MPYQASYDISFYLSKNCHYPYQWPCKNSPTGVADHGGPRIWFVRFSRNLHEIENIFVAGGTPWIHHWLLEPRLSITVFDSFIHVFFFVLACSRPHSPVCSYRLQEIGVVHRLPLKEITIDVEMMNNFIRLIGKSQSGLLPPFRTMFPWERDAEGVSFRLKGICLIHANRSIIILFFPDNLSYLCMTLLTVDFNSLECQGMIFTIFHKKEKLLFPSSTYEITQ